MIVIVALLLIVSVIAVLVAAGVITLGGENICPTGADCGDKDHPAVPFEIRAEGRAQNPCLSAPATTITLRIVIGGTSPTLQLVRLDPFPADVRIHLDSMTVTYPKGISFNLPDNKKPADQNLRLGACGGLGDWGISTYWKGVSGHYSVTARVTLTQLGCVICPTPQSIGSSLAFDL